MLTGKDKDAPIWALGCMSGTSLDGVDAALVQTDGVTISSFGKSAFRAYDLHDQSRLRAALGTWHGDDGVAEAAELIETAHAVLLSRFAEEQIDIIGFHGQTLAHDPRGRGTHQAGDGQVLAELTGVPVVWDFRSADVQLGGEGAPLAPFFHHACAQFIGATKPLVFLNLGGVGNMTWVDPNVAAPEDEGACLAFDTGPANAPVNDLMQSRRGIAVDQDGQLALSGTADTTILEQFLNHPYFFRMPPKSLDRDSFKGLEESVAHLSDADAAATLVACAAAAVARGLEHCPTAPARVLVTGGGRHNMAMMSELDARCDAEVASIDDVGLDGDMLEAQAFAYLAVRVSKGLATSSPTTTGVAAAVGGGNISTPENT